VCVCVCACVPSLCVYVCVKEKREKERESKLSCFLQFVQFVLYKVDEAEVVNDVTAITKEH
jgi:hypothetical protein